MGDMGVPAPHVFANPTEHWGSSGCASLGRLQQVQDCWVKESMTGLNDCRLAEALERPPHLDYWILNSFNNIMHYLALVLEPSL